MSSSSIPEAATDSAFACDWEKQAHSACARERFYKEHNGQRYCVLHLPATDKSAAFDIEIKRKLESKDFNFEGVWFPDGRWFSNLEIDEPVNFRRAIFNNRASFYKTVFRSEVNFEGATFNDRSGFEHATFAKKVNFSNTRFQKDANFRKARFEGNANFWRSTFIGSAEFDDSVFLQTASFWPAIFDSTASFSRASFVWANFRASEFKAKAVFSWCVFGFAEFIDTSFSNDADFFSARCEGMINFAHARFDKLARLTMCKFKGEARFTSTAFNGETDFSHTEFKAAVEFSAEYGRGGFGSNAACDFRHTRFEIPKRVSFHSMTLRPHWFINVDPREFQFINVTWIGNLDRKFIDVEISELKKREEIEDKEADERRAEHLKSAEEYNDKFTIERLKREEVEEASIGANDSDQKRLRFYRLLSIVCRQLAGNAEDNHRYEEASKLRYWAMDVRRLEQWRGFAFWRLSWWYWLASGYGERILRALVVFTAVWLGFTILYRLPEPIRCSDNNPNRQVCIRWMTTDDKQTFFDSSFNSAVYTIEVMTLQKPEPRPKSTLARLAITLCTILGPLQAALLALAIRRKFMR